MADNQQSQAATQAQKDEPVLFFGMVRIVNEPGVLVCEDGLSVFKTHPVLA